MPSNNNYVFISYSHQDKTYVGRIKQELARHGIDYFVDDHVKFGSIIFDQLEQGLKKCKAVIVIVSSHSMNSTWVKNEIDFALTHEKKIFPLLLEGSEFRLGLYSMKYADVRGHEMPPTNFFMDLKSFLLASNQDILSLINNAENERADALRNANESNVGDLNLKIDWDYIITGYDLREQVNIFGESLEQGDNVICLKLPSDDQIIFSDFLVARFKWYIRNYLNRECINKNVRLDHETNSSRLGTNSQSIVSKKIRTTHKCDVSDLVTTLAHDTILFVLNSKIPCKEASEVAKKFYKEVQEAKRPTSGYRDRYFVILWSNQPHGNFECDMFRELPPIEFDINHIKKWFYNRLQHAVSESKIVEMLDYLDRSYDFYEGKSHRVLGAMRNVVEHLNRGKELL